MEDIFEDMDITTEPPLDWTTELLEPPINRLKDDYEFTDISTINHPEGGLTGTSRWK